MTRILVDFLHGCKILCPPRDQPPPMNCTFIATTPGVPEEIMILISAGRLSRGGILIKDTPCLQNPSRTKPPIKLPTSPPGPSTSSSSPMIYASQSLDSCARNEDMFLSCQVLRPGSPEPSFALINFVWFRYSRHNCSKTCKQMELYFVSHRKFVRCCCCCRNIAS